MALTTVETLAVRAVTRELRAVTRRGATAWRAPNTAEEATAAILGNDWRNRSSCGFIQMFFNWGRGWGVFDGGDGGGESEGG